MTMAIAVAMLSTGSLGVNLRAGSGAQSSASWGAFAKFLQDTSEKVSDLVDDNPIDDIASKIENIKKAADSGDIAAVLENSASLAEKVPGEEGQKIAAAAAMAKDVAEDAKDVADAVKDKDLSKAVDSGITVAHDVAPELDTSAIQGASTQASTLAASLQSGNIAGAVTQGAALTGNEQLKQVVMPATNAALAAQAGDLKGLTTVAAS